MIDTHAHLNEIDNPEAVIGRARQVGIEKIVSIGMDLASNQAALALAQRFPQRIVAAIGYHPWSIVSEEIQENLDFIRDNLHACVALGEIGLDYRAKVKKKIQWQVYESLLTIARQHDVPVIVHARFSHQRSYRMAKDAGIKKLVFHWYSGPLDILQQIIESGYYVSATPALAYSPQHRSAMENAPLARILMETDAPVEYQDKATEPADLVVTLRELSHIKGMPEEDIVRITTANAEQFFGISTQRMIA